MFKVVCCRTVVWGKGLTKQMTRMKYRCMLNICSSRLSQNIKAKEKIADKIETSILLQQLELLSECSSWWYLGLVWIWVMSAQKIGHYPCELGSYGQEQFLNSSWKKKSSHSSRTRVLEQFIAHFKNSSRTLLFLISS